MKQRKPRIEDFRWDVCGNDVWNVTIELSPDSEVFESLGWAFSGFAKFCGLPIEPMPELDNISEGQTLVEIEATIEMMKKYKDDENVQYWMMELLKEHKDEIMKYWSEDENTSGD